MPVPLTAIPKAIPAAFTTEIFATPDAPVALIETPELPGYDSLVVVFFIAAHNAGCRLHPAFDKVQPFTRVLSGRNLMVPDTALEFATDSTTTAVMALTLITLAPCPSPVPTAVIPAAIPLVLPTTKLVEPDAPVPVVETAVAPAKTIVLATAPEFAADKFV
jgi:hypothetical protein